MAAFIALLLLAQFSCLAHGLHNTTTRDHSKHISLNHPSSFNPAILYNTASINKSGTELAASCDHRHSNHNAATCDHRRSNHNAATCDHRRSTHNAATCDNTFELPRHNDQRTNKLSWGRGSNFDLKFAAYLYAWDATKPGPTGPQLYASDPRSLSTPLGEVVTFNVPGCLTLTGSTEYVAFLSSAGFWPGGSQKVTLIDSSSTTLAGSRRISSTTASNSTATFQTTDMWAAQPAPPLGKNIALSVTYY
ncbi:hypothetical protein COCSUDRAFT_40806 [Coccomyxa subellipsoidea C-169]|uniref:Uncharacterized protein n=1 Tax=Coccomyxa subellipsoidea (strain C-169) TaxID=574566 RepID=I0Z178_COCSC|nr:hypothetical protein COCSUDRAFT_40806 [Coccomyxa subellipsoidea C-169]EIE24397.1 hypothetical protein COCSUDRAFT_40806 [Coccomyxa subellipsoidea C-169]|eukprot:XP_005648941.1 hypothetical protein COCSUDRAFT_40806 [Coccomyxa subellipsoidea C-169]